MKENSILKTLTTVLDLAQWGIDESEPHLAQRLNEIRDEVLFELADIYQIDTDQMNWQQKVLDYA